MGTATMGLKAIAGRCFSQFNLVIPCKVWKPAHLWLAPCGNGHALTLMTTAAQGGRGVRATEACMLRRQQNNSARPYAKHIAPVVCLRAPQAFEKWRSAPQKQHPAGRNNSPVVLLPGQGPPRTERLPPRHVTRGRPPLVIQRNCQN